MAHAPHLLITSADDFGLTPAVNTAVEAAHEAGALASASLLVAAPAAREAAAIARRHPRLGVGLHLNLTEGEPLTGPAPSLTRHGRFLGRRALELQALAGRIRPAEVERELRAQLAAAAELGVAVDHIDGHQHAHILPGAAPAVARVAAEIGLPVRLPHHRFVRRGRPGLRGWLKMARRTALDRALAPARAELERAGVPSPVHFTSSFDLLPLPHRFGIEEARVLLVTLRGGATEWMLHPAVEPLPGEAGTALGRLRPAEHSLLLSPALPELIAALGFRLGTYAELAASRVRAAA